jgi:uncharacterized protein
MNYQSAVVHGIARCVTDPEEKWSALRSVVEHLAPGSWTYARQPDKREVAATTVIAVSLAEASVKVRSGPPKDEADDIEVGGRWTGVLPVRPVFEPPETDPTIAEDGPPPAHVINRAKPQPRSDAPSDHVQ